MIPSGLKPVNKDHRDRSYRGTFGAIVEFKDFNFDTGVVGFPDQNAEGRPYGCTGETQSAACSDEDGVRYKAQYTYDKTRVMENSYPQPVGCDIRNSLKSTIVYGLQKVDETSDAEAGYHRRGAYYSVVDYPGMDSFEDIWNAAQHNDRTVSMATPWFMEWQSVGSDGILPMPNIPNHLKRGFLGSLFRLGRTFGRVFGTMYGDEVSYHNWQIVKGEAAATPLRPLLVGKSWQGPNYGDGGYHKMTREVLNAVMDCYGAGAFTLRRATTEDYTTVKLRMLETILSYLSMLVRRIFA